MPDQTYSLDTLDLVEDAEVEEFLRRLSMLHLRIEELQKAEAAIWSVFNVPQS